jgi:hypothetical protein
MNRIPPLYGDSASGELSRANDELHRESRVRKGRGNEKRAGVPDVPPLTVLAAVSDPA